MIVSVKPFAKGLSEGTRGVEEAAGRVYGTGPSIDPTDKIAYPMCAYDDSLYMFTQFICSKEVDWSLCGERAYDCFSKFFNMLKNALPTTTGITNPYFDINQNTDMYHTDLSQTDISPFFLGLDTLWKIVIYISSENAMIESSTLLLDTYDVINRSNYNSSSGGSNSSSSGGRSGSSQSMLERIFTQLNNANIELSNTTNNTKNKKTPTNTICNNNNNNNSNETSSSLSLLVVDRLVKLLSAAILRDTDKGDRWGRGVGGERWMGGSGHAVQGCLSR